MNKAVCQRNERQGLDRWRMLHGSSWDFCPKKTRPKGSRNGNKVMALMTGHKINMASHNKARGNKAASLNGSFHLLKSHKV
jgi:hypothetical protein